MKYVEYLHQLSDCHILLCYVLILCTKIAILTSAVVRKFETDTKLLMHCW